MLRRRDDSELSFVSRLEISSRVVLDTTVYIDQLQNRLPAGLQASFHAQNAWHSSVTACEMSALVGLLDPSHPRTSSTVEEVVELIDRRRENRTIVPDADTWVQAGILAGLLARLQQYGKAEQRRVLNDALIFLSAAKAGFTVLTRNVVDYDLLMQLAPQGKVIFYRV